MRKPSKILQIFLKKKKLDNYAKICIIKSAFSISPISAIYLVVISSNKKCNKKKITDCYDLEQ